MYAIIETGGKQYWVLPGEKIKVEKLEAEAEAGKELSFKALWAAGASGESDSKPANAATVTALVVRNFRAPKIIVFKKRSKKAYKKTIGHRQNMTEILIKSININ